MFPRTNSEDEVATKGIRLGGWTWASPLRAASKNDAGPSLPVDYRISLHPESPFLISEAGAPVVFDGGDSFMTGYRLELAGHEFWVHARGTVVRRQDGVAVSLFGVAIDVTHQRALLIERTRTLEDSVRQARIFDATLSAIRDTVYVFDLDGKFRYANRALLELWGSTLEQVVGKDFFDLNYPGPLAIRLQQQIEQVILTGRPLTDETAYESPTGVRGYYEYIFSPIFAADGSVEAVAGTTRDITARKQVEEDLRRRTAQFETLLDQTPLGVYLLDADMRIRGANPMARTFFGDIPDLLGRDVGEIMRELWSNSEADELLRRFRFTVATGEMSLMYDRADFSLGVKADHRYQGFIHRIAGDDGRPGAVCYFRAQPMKAPQTQA
jgi:PAS domain S-box-containing protein